MTPHPTRWLFAAVASCLLAPLPVGAGEEGASATEPALTARAVLHDREGHAVGEATLRESPHGVLVHARFDGLPPGVRAFHIHEKGVCEPPFTSAGGHFNPEGRKHGLEAEKGPHAGDLPNLHIPETGVLEIDVLASGVTLGPGPSGLLEGDGTSLVVHAGPDDYATDPAGDAGERIACGVIEAAPAP